MGSGSRSLSLSSGARPRDHVGSLVRDDEIDSIFKQPILRPSLRAQRSNPSRRAKEEWIASSLPPSLVELRRTSRSSQGRGSNFRYDPAIPRRDPPEVLQDRSPQKNRGRRECRVPNAPAASRAKLNKAHERSHHGHTGINPAFPAQWFYGLLPALPVDRPCFTPPPRPL